MEKALNTGPVLFTHTHTHTHRHTDTQTHRHTDTQTHRHTDTHSGPQSPVWCVRWPLQSHTHTNITQHATHKQKNTRFLCLYFCCLYLTKGLTVQMYFLIGWTV